MRFCIMSFCRAPYADLARRVREVDSPQALGAPLGQDVCRAGRSSLGPATRSATRGEQRRDRVGFGRRGGSASEHTDTLEAPS
jgi:hypothetical protein